jgi:hypothetical protein
VSWDPSHWTRTRKIILGIATVWPPIYMMLFMVAIFSMIAFFGLRSAQFKSNTENIDLIQLENKINNRELSQITVTRDEIIACDRSCQCEYHTPVTSRSTRAEIIRQASQVDENGKALVPKIEETSSQPQLPAFLPIGFAAFFGIHMLSIMLMFVLLPIYILLAVNRPQFDQTTRIVWIVLICLMGNLAMPAYWFAYVWPARGES